MMQQKIKKEEWGIEKINPLSNLNDYHFKDILILGVS